VLQTLLTGVRLPAERSDLLAYARRQRADRDLLAALRYLPEREYRSIDEVAEAILPVQPRREQAGPREPRTESGAPPGGDAYGR
jgi:uncharacterized protein DUF2795